MRRPADAAKHLADRARSKVRLELEQAADELKRKVAAIGVGIGLLLGAAVLGFFAVCFTLATITAAIATALPLWAALLIVTGLLFVLVGSLVFFGIRAIRKGKRPAPEQALADATGATPRP